MKAATSTIRIAALALMSIAAACATAGPRSVEDFPHRPIKLIVPYPPGGSVDALARTVAEKLRETWGQPVIVDNRGGAGGNIGAEAVWRSPPDGYTLLFAAPGPYVINRFIYGKLEYDPRTFVPVSIVSTSHTLLVSKPTAPFTTLRQFVDYAKAHPDQLTYASSGNGTASHLATESFCAHAGIKMTHVPYKGSGPAMTDVAAGQVDVMFVELSAALAMVKAGKLRALGLGSAARKPGLPEVPAIAEALPGFVSSTWFGIAAPPHTPPSIANRISNAVAQVLKSPDVASRLAAMDVDGIGSSGAQMAAFMKEEAERWSKVVRSTGAKAE